MKSIVLLGCGIAAVAVAGFVFADFEAGAASDGEAENRSVFKVKRGELVVTLTESGTLVAKESKRVKPEGSRGEAKITWLIDEGSVVKEGDEVAKLDTEKLVESIEELETELGQARTSDGTNRTELDIQKTDNITSIEAAEMGLDKAEKELERYRDGDAKQARRNLAIKIKDMESELSRARKRLENSRVLVEQNYIRKTELEDHEIQFEKASVQAEGANLDLELHDKYTFPMTMAEKEAAVRKAKRDLETARKRAKSKLAQKQNLVDEGLKKVKKLEKRLKERRERLEKMTLKAPVPGIVFYGDPREPWRRNEIRVGASVWSGHTLITIPDLRVMQVKVKIHEADITKVKVGQKVHITMDTYPGKVLAGEVTKVAQIAGTRDRWGDNTEVKVFDVETTLKGTAELGLKPGVSAKAEIFIDRKPDTMFVPLQSVGIDGEQNYCNVINADGKPERREIEVGISSDNYIEVLGGLAIGDEVLLYNPMLPDAPVETEDESGAEDKASDGDAKTAALSK